MKNLCKIPKEGLSLGSAEITWVPGCIDRLGLTFFRFFYKIRSICRSLQDFVQTGRIGGLPAGMKYIGGLLMETKVAVLSIIVENNDTVEALNRLLHSYGDCIIGRMGLPYRQKHINLISLAVDAPEDVICKLTAEIDELPGVRAKAISSSIN